MSRADRDRWDRKYRESGRAPSSAPDPLLVAHAGLFRGAGLALDVACGTGQNSLFLARHGYEVIGVDGSIEGLKRARAAAAAAGLSAAWIAADLDRFQIPAQRFDLVIVFRFLNRGLLPDLARSLRPGGVLICQTFNLNWLRDHPAFNRDWLLHPGELRSWFPGFEVIGGNDAPGLADPQSNLIWRRSV